MSGAVKQILEAALKLSEEDREQLVDELKATLHSGFGTAEVEGAWAREIERRSNEIDSGKAVLRDWLPVAVRSGCFRFPELNVAGSNPVSRSRKAKA